MATNLEIITDALRLLNVINNIQAPTSEQSSQGLTALNDMLADWQEDGIELGYYPQTSLAATIPVQDQYLRGIKYNLAEELSTSYGTELLPKAQQIAAKSYARLAKETLEVVESSMDHLPSGYTYYDINVE